MAGYKQSRGPEAKRGTSRIRTGRYPAGIYQGSTLTQIVAILIALGLLSVVAIPRYMDAKRDRLREAQEAQARSFIRALHGALTVNIANHYLRGLEWVEDGEELMGLLEEGWAIPKGMRYSDNVWIHEKTGLAWEFKKASHGLPPRIRRVQDRSSPENWEMEPIRQVRETSHPDS